MIRHDIFKVKCAVIRHEDIFKFKCAVIRREDNVNCLEFAVLYLIINIFEL